MTWTYTHNRIHTLLTGCINIYITNQYHFRCLYILFFFIVVLLLFVLLDTHTHTHTHWIWTKGDDKCVFEKCANVRMYVVNKTLIISDERNLRHWNPTFAFLKGANVLLSVCWQGFVKFSSYIYNLLFFLSFQVQKKRRIVARVQCKNIKNECPKPTCDEPVLLPGRCCKTCPGDHTSKCFFFCISCSCFFSAFFLHILMKGTVK